MDVSQPPPQLTLPSALATNLTMLPPPPSSGPHFRHFHPHHGGNKQGGYQHFKPFTPGGFQRPFTMSQDDFDGKRLRKSVMRKTVDYNASIVRGLETRLSQRDYRDRYALQPESIYVPQLLPPSSYLDNPSNAVTTRFVKTATNKMRCPIFTLAWTPEGRRLVTGASSGEFTLWNGLTFNFETILQAHDVPVRTMVWSHNDSWMVTGDHNGYVKYWQSNMNNVKMYQAHKEAIRGISFSPTDSKFVSCSDDGTLRIWDFMRCQEERVLRGHGADVKCVHWHPQKGIIVSGSKDNQQPIKLWDPKSGTALATLHAHKSTVMDLKWNDNGNWLVTASRDHLLKLFDIRNLREEVQVFRGHKKEASSVSWHPIHEGLFCSGGSDGSILFWNVGTDKEIGGVETAHDSIVWTLAWHPLGHILCSGSNDHTIKFWTRNRPGDLMRDKYNLNTLPASLAALDECEYDDAVIPGMGPEDRVEFTESLTADKGFIPGLDLDPSKLSDRDKEKKVPYSKPIPRNFQAQWAGARGRTDDGGFSSGNGTGTVVGGTGVLEESPPAAVRDTKDTNGISPQQVGENTIEGMLASGNLTNMDPHSIVGILVYGRFIRVHPDSRLMLAVRQGPDYLNKYIDAGKLEELRDVLPMREHSRSVSPTIEGLEASPPLKKSRFEPRQHQPLPVFVCELLSLKKPFLPCLLALKAQLLQQAQPQLLMQNNSDIMLDDMNDRGSPHSLDMGGPVGRPNPWANNSPWAKNNGPGPGNNNQNGYNGNNNNNNNGIAPFNGPGGFGGGSSINEQNFNERDRERGGERVDHQKGNNQNNNNSNNNNSGGSNNRRRRNNNSSGGSSGGNSRNRGRNNNRRF